MRRAASPAPPRPATAGSRKPTAGPCSSTSSAPCRCRRRTGCCARSNMARSPASARRKPISVDVRIVAATNENLPSLVDQGKFRADLLDRLSFEVITLAAAARAPGRHPAARRAFRAAHGGRARMDQLARLHVRARWPRSKPIRGPAMCANCAMSSNARSIATKTPNARSTRSISTRFMSPVGAGDDRRCRVPSSPKTSGEDRRPLRASRRAAGAGSTTDDLRGAVAAYERQLLEDALAPQPLQPARDRRRASASATTSCATR